MAARKKKKRRKSLAPKILLALFVVFVSCVLIKNQIDANRQKKEIASTELEIAEVSNLKAWYLQELATEIDNDYIAREAEKQGYAGPNDRIFYDKSGS